MIIEIRMKITQLNNPLILFSDMFDQRCKLLKISIFASLIIFSAFGKCFGQAGTNINNPVLPGVADAGVIKFNGEYYIGGVFTNGGFYKSKDLIKWEGPVHVFSMNNKWTEGRSADDSQIHANDMNYLNGVFHLFWSVNYWGRDRNVVHIGHATSPDILGPYTEPVKDTWVDNRIDPEMFVDDDGEVYLYMVKFTDGNTIWARKMKDPWTFSGEPMYLFSSLPNTWETLDNRVEEGPWVIKYRGRYYLMYNANHTSPSWGNYALGVAEADSPLGFNHGNKYPYPLVESNQIALEAAAVDLLKFGSKDRGLYQYTFTRPDSSWANADFNSAHWPAGKGGFGSNVIRNSTTRKIGTEWNTPQIWLRRSFNLDKNSSDNLMLRIYHDGDTKVFLNGHSIYEKADRVYTTWNFDDNARALLNDGENMLAVESNAGRASKYLDVSLFNLKSGKGDDILFSPGQPNILTGPNGFEWWLIYMANKNNDRRGQYINRVHFFDKRMFVDGITASNTPGYHPPPAAPTFSELFSGKDEWKTHWDVSSGSWAVNNNELLQTANSNAKILLNSLPATHFLFQASIKMVDTAKTLAGVIAWWKDEKNWLKIFLNPQNNTWKYVIVENGKQKAASFFLAKGFISNAYHTVAVYKNGSVFTVKIDDLPAPVRSTIKSNFKGKGLPGLFTEGGKAAFDGLLYTVGWDEYDTTVTGWEPAISQQATNTSKVTKQGITLNSQAQENTVLKGDELPTYEFSTQLTAQDKNGSAGIYPAYIDRNNYMKAIFDFKTQRFIVAGRKNGLEIPSKEISLEGYKDYHADMKYTDFFEKHFTLHTPSLIHGIRMSMIPHGRQDTIVQDIYQKMDISYKRNGQWYPLNLYKAADDTHPAFASLSFDPVEAEAVKFVNKVPGDQNFYVTRIWVKEFFNQSYNIRIAKLKEQIIFIIDGKEVLTVKNDFPSSRVGLFAENTEVHFNGITFFHIP
jgi:GH43 family beta-xylosidase